MACRKPQPCPPTTRGPRASSTEAATDAGSGASREGSPGISGCPWSGCGWCSSDCSWRTGWARSCMPRSGSSCPSASAASAPAARRLFTTETSPDGRRRLVARKPDKGQIVALLLMVVVAMVFVGNVNLGGGTKAYLWPTVLVGAGVALVWRQADNARRARWAEVGRRRRTLSLLRSAAGVLLVTAACLRDLRPPGLRGPPRLGAPGGARGPRRHRAAHAAPI